MSVAAVPDFDTQHDVCQCREKRQAERRMVGYDLTPPNRISGELPCKPFEFVSD